MMLDRPRRVTFALLCLSPCAALAQTAPNADGDIVILGAGLDLPPGKPAYGASVLDRNRLANGASGRVEDVLADVAGFQQFRRSDSRSANPSAQGATLRALGGNASSRTLVLLDGVPVADPFFGYIPFNALASDRLSAVRITRGVGSGAFGSGAVAGTIELISAERRDLPLIGGDAFYGSRNSESVSAGISPSLGGGFATLSGRFERGDGFHITPVDQRVSATVPTRYRDWSAGARAVIPVGPAAELQVRGLLFGDSRTLRFRGADSSSEGEDASIRFLLHRTWQVDAHAYVQARNFTNKVISATTFKLALDQRNTPSTGMGGKIELRPPVGSDHVLRLGSDIRLADGEMFEDAYAATGLATTRRNAGGKTTTLGLFVEDDWTIGRLVLTGGVRIDRWAITDGFFRERNGVGVLTANNSFADRKGTEVTGRGGVLLHAASGVYLRAAAYTGFRLPTLNELYRPFTVFPITTQANAALSPERLRGVEAGVDLEPVAGMEVGLTAFYNRLGDTIANVTIDTNLRRRTNIDEIEAKGVEATIAWHNGAIMMSASYALSDSKMRASGMAFDGLRPAQSPRHAASATLAWAPKSGAILSATVRYVGNQYEDDLQTDILPAATTIGAFAKLPITRSISVVARAENLFDEEVVTRNQAGSIDLGTPRTLWIGVRIEG